MRRWVGTDFIKRIPTREAKTLEQPVVRPSDAIKIGGEHLYSKVTNDALNHVEPLRHVRNHLVIRCPTHLKLTGCPATFPFRHVMPSWVNHAEPQAVDVARRVSVNNHRMLRAEGANDSVRSHADSSRDETMRWKQERKGWDDSEQKTVIGMYKPVMTLGRPQFRVITEFGEEVWRRLNFDAT